MEAIVQDRTWEDFAEDKRGLFVETFVPKGVIRPLDEQEMEAYRAPFRDPAARTPALVWPREIPIEREPGDVAGIVGQYGNWLSRPPLPKLFIKGEPGAILAGRASEFCRSWPNQRETTVRALHFLQEDSPDDIGAALRDFLAAL